MLVAGGEETERSITKSIQLRTSLKPYVMELAANATAHGTPLMVPLWWYFPDDPELQVRRTHQMSMVARLKLVVAAQHNDDPTELMLGPKYLAAPVLRLGQRNRTLYLPKTDGGWTHYYSRARFAGGANVTVAAPFDELPLFVRQYS